MTDSYVVRAVGVDISVQLPYRQMKGDFLLDVY